MAMKFPRHLWTGEWRLESEQAREAAEEEAARRRAALAAAERDRAAAQPPPGAPPRTIRLKTGGGRGAGRGGRRGRRLRRRRAAARRRDRSQPLPAVSGKPSRPTRASRAPARSTPRPARRSSRSAPTCGSGTGFLIDSNGTLVTNAHVVGNADRVVVKFGPDGDSIDGEVKGADPSSDLAVVQDRPGQRAAQRQAAAVRRLAPGPGRRHRDRHRQPVRPRPHGDRGHRLGHRARDQGAQRLLDRRGHPDRRADQPRQLRRPAARRHRPRHRRQLADRHRGQLAGQRRHRLRRPVEHRARGRARGSRRATRSRARTSACETSRSDRPQRAARRRGDHGHPRRPRRERAASNAGDVITEIDGQAVNGSDDVSRIVNTKQPGDHLRIRVDRSGQDVTLDATLQNRPARHAVSPRRTLRRELRRAPRAGRSCWPSRCSSRSTARTSATAAAPRPPSRRPR